MFMQSQAWTDIDFHEDGKQVDHLFIPYSVHRSAYGNVAIPMVALRNGDGPKILLTAGNHGDEFEGQIVAARIARALEAQDISGTLIIVPGLNFPAAASGSRVSPLDGGNLNRSFPGEARGTPTQQIAYHLHTVLMPMVDVVIDLHSGGSSLDYLPTAFTHLCGEPGRDATALAAMRAFGAPLTMVFPDDDDPRRAFASALHNNCLYLSTELGGTGSVNPETLSFSYAGTVRLLSHFGLLRRPQALGPLRAPEHTRFVQIAGRDHQLHATRAGIFEPHFRLGDAVRAGQLAGLIYSQHEPTREPAAAYFKADGFVICRRHQAQVEAGDCLAHTAIDYDAELQ